MSPQKKDHQNTKLSKHCSKFTSKSPMESVRLCDSGEQNRSVDSPEFGT